MAVDAESPSDPDSANLVSGVSSDPSPYNGPSYGLPTRMWIQRGSWCRYIKRHIYAFLFAQSLLGLFIACCIIRGFSSSFPLVIPWSMVAAATIFTLRLLFTWLVMPEYPPYFAKIDGTHRDFVKNDPKSVKREFEMAEGVIDA